MRVRGGHRIERRATVDYRVWCGDCRTFLTLALDRPHYVPTVAAARAMLTAKEGHLAVMHSAKKKPTRDGWLPGC